MFDIKPVVAGNSWLIISEGAFSEILDGYIVSCGSLTTYVTFCRCSPEL
jgi:hypothetical protein